MAKAARHTAGSARRSIDQVATMVRSSSDTVAALVLFNGWIFAMSWGGIFRAPFDEASSVLVMHGLWLTSLLVCTLVLLGFLCLPRRLRAVRGGVLVFALACMTGSVALAVASDGVAGGAVGAEAESAARALFMASGVASGLGTGVMSAYWGRLITRYDSGAVMAFMAVALVGSALIALAVAAMPRPVALALMALMPFPLVGFFARAAGFGGSCGAAGAVADGDVADAPFPAHRAMFFVLAVVLGASAGLLRELTGADVAPMTRAFVFGAATICAAVMLLLSKMPGEGESFALFYRAIAFISGAFIILTIVVQQAAYQSALALGLHTMGFMYFYGLLWVFCVIYAQRSRDAAAVFVAGLFANQIGQIAGALAGGGLAVLLGAGSFISTASNAMIYVLLFVVIALMARLSVEKPLSSASSSKPMFPLATAEGMAQACERAADRFALTPRETEILPYLARGYDRSYIAEALVVSPETVKSHTRHIYEKLGVHTRVELFNAVATCLASDE